MLCLPVHMIIADKQSSIQLVLISTHTVKSSLVFSCCDYYMFPIISLDSTVSLVNDNAEESVYYVLIASFLIL